MVSLPVFLVSSSVQFLPEVALRSCSESVSCPGQFVLFAAWFGEDASDKGGSEGLAGIELLRDLFIVLRIRVIFELSIRWWVDRVEDFMNSRFQRTVVPSFFLMRYDLDVKFCISLPSFQINSTLCNGYSTTICPMLHLSSSSYVFLFNLGIVLLVLRPIIFSIGDCSSFSCGVFLMFSNPMYGSSPSFAFH